MKKISSGLKKDKQNSVEITDPKKLLKAECTQFGETMKTIKLLMLICFISITTLSLHAKGDSKEYFENEKVKLIGVVIKEGESSGWMELKNSSVFYFYEEGMVRIKYEGSAPEVKVIKKNQTVVPKGNRVQIQNIGSNNLRFMIVEIKG